MLDLKAVLEWYPEMADAYDLLALARNEGGGPAAAMQAERAAMTLSPRDERYVYHLAQIYIASKKWDAAEALLERLKNSSNPATRRSRPRAHGASWHRAQIQRLSRSQRRAPVKPAQQKSPFDVLEEDAAKRSAADKATQSGPRRTHASQNSSKAASSPWIVPSAPAAILTVTAGRRRPEAPRTGLQIAAPHRRRRFLLRMDQPPGHRQLQARRTHRRRPRLTRTPLRPLLPSRRCLETISHSDPLSPRGRMIGW